MTIPGLSFRESLRSLAPESLNQLAVLCMSGLFIACLPIASSWLSAGKNASGAGRNAGWASSTKCTGADHNCLALERKVAIKAPPLKRKADRVIHIHPGHNGWSSFGFCYHSPHLKGGDMISDIWLFLILDTLLLRFRSVIFVRRKRMVFMTSVVLKSWRSVRLIVKRCFSRHLWCSRVERSVRLGVKKCFSRVRMLWFSGLWGICF